MLIENARRLTADLMLEGASPETMTLQGDASFLPKHLEYMFTNAMREHYGKYLDAVRPIFRAHDERRAEALCLTAWANDFDAARQYLPAFARFEKSSEREMLRQLAPHQLALSEAMAAAVSKLLL